MCIFTLFQNVFVVKTRFSRNVGVPRKSSFHNKHVLEHSQDAHYGFLLQATLSCISNHWFHLTPFKSQFDFWNKSIHSSGLFWLRSIDSSRSGHDGKEPANELGGVAT